MITICASPMQAIRLGRVGENERLRVAFDVSALLAELPGATFTVINLGPGGAAAYPCPGVTLEDGTLYWPITSAELTATGRGRCELIVTPAVYSDRIEAEAVFLEKCAYARRSGLDAHSVTLLDQEGQVIARKCFKA